MYKFLSGYNGRDNSGFDTLQKATKEAHTSVIGEPPEPAASQFVSMWRDLNPYNEIGIPAISYGFATPTRLPALPPAGPPRRAPA